MTDEQTKADQEMRLSCVSLALQMPGLNGRSATQLISDADEIWHFVLDGSQKPTRLDK